MGGRKYGESAKLAWFIYPLMQVVDVYSLGTHIAQGGVDQRKAYVLAREVWDRVRLMPLRLGERSVKPIIVLHHLIPALNLKGTESREELSEAKMSKSKPDTALFLHDQPDEVRRKVLNAYCPPKVLEGNPVLDLARVFSFREPRKTPPFTVEKPAQFGGGEAGVLDLRGAGQGLRRRRCSPARLEEDGGGGGRQRHGAVPRVVHQGRWSGPPRGDEEVNGGERPARLIDGERYM